MGNKKYGRIVNLLCLFLVTLFLSDAGWATPLQRIEIRQCQGKGPKIIVYADFLDGSGVSIAGISHESITATIGSNKAEVIQVEPF